MAGRAVEGECEPVRGQDERQCSAKPIARVVADVKAQPKEHFTGRSNSPERLGLAPRPPPPAAPRSNCDPSYPDVCIPPPPPDLDRAGVPYSGFAVRRNDPHGFDSDGDGIGCE